ncbi:MAG: hypothetical protein ACJ77C_11290, partial [Chloroflexota bacterium]
MPDQSRHAPDSSTRVIRRILAVGAASALILAVVGPPAIAASKTTSIHTSKAKITKVHQTHLAKTTSHLDAEETADPETGRREVEEFGVKAPGSQSAKRVPAAHVPTPAGLSVTGAAGAGGFDGQTHRDQRNAGTGVYANTNFSTEPPDMGLCVGNGFVVQGVNSSLRVYSPSGTPLTAPTALNQLFGATPEVDRTHLATDGTVTYGDQVGDVKCYYDADVDRFFV